ILSVTCDNASVNNVMIEELKDLLTAFLRPANQTQCFAHIVNLVAKSLLKLFDTLKKSAMASLDDLENKSNASVAQYRLEHELQDLTEGIDVEEA
ncbi:hypothetical protein C0992_004561, partial [Termitomyces sp. T32_za158]